MKFFFLFLLREVSGKFFKSDLDTCDFLVSFVNSEILIVFSVFFEREISQFLELSFVNSIKFEE